MTNGGVSTSSQIDDTIGQEKLWRYHFQDWQDSGLSQRAYCRKNNLSEYRFSRWKRRLANDETCCRFVPVPKPAQHLRSIKRGVLRVHCPNGFRIDVEDDFDPGLLKNLLTVLAEV